jgi:UDP-3-O-[3-hydroxymyristoyl] glucosamine N-acyltransferase
MPDPTLTVAEIVRLIDGELLVGSEPEPITGVAALADAEPGDVSFFANPKYLPALRRSRAAAVLVPADFQPPEDWDMAGRAIIRAANPSLAFAKLVEHFSPPPFTHAPGVAPTAVLGRDVQLGPDVSIQPYAVIEDGARIDEGAFIGAHAFIGAGSVVGAGSKIYPHVTIHEGTRIGQRVIIHSGTVIGADGFGFELQNGRHVKIPQTGIVQIDDDVEIGANTTIDRARFGRTHIGEGTKIDNLVQIAHNVVVGPHCLIISQTGISGSARLGRYVTLAGQVGVVGHVEIGDQVIIAAKSGASKDVPPKSVLFGIIGEPIKQAKENIVHLRRLPKLVERIKKMEAELAALKAKMEISE